MSIPSALPREGLTGWMSGPPAATPRESSQFPGRPPFSREVRDGPGLSTARGKIECPVAETGTDPRPLRMAPLSSWHTPLLPVDKADGTDTKFSFITSSSKSSIGYSSGCLEDTEGYEGGAGQAAEQTARTPQARSGCAQPAVQTLSATHTRASRGYLQAPQCPDAFL